MKEKILNYVALNCGMGKSYSHPSVLLDKLRKTRRPRWAGIPVSEFIATLKELISSDGITKESR